MKCEYCKAKLADLTTTGKGIYGIAASGVEKNDNLYTYLRITDINDDGTLNRSDMKSVADDDAIQYLLKPNDIVFARTGGSTGRNYFYDGKDGTLVYAGFLIKFSIDPLKVNPKYIKYYCQSDVYKNWVRSFNTGSTRGNINAQTFGNMEIPLPPREQQDYLVSVLEPLDEKIAINREINDNLEQQLRTIFKAEFTDNPELENITQIPLSELCHVVTKGTTPTTLGKPFVESGINFIKAESILDDHSIDKSKFAFIDEETNALLKRSIIHAGDVVFTIAGTLGRFALIDENVLPANTNQAVAIIRADVEKVLPEYIYTCFIGEWHTDYYAKRVQQAVQANLSLTTIKSLPIPLLDEAKMSEYLSLILPLIKAIKTNEAQNEKLAALRDNLLPKLMSGEIDVSDVQL